MAKVGDQHSVGGEMSRRSGEKEASDFEFARDERRMQRTRAAIGNDGKIAYVESAFGRDAFDHICHLRDGDTYDTVCGCDHVEAKRTCDFVQDSRVRGFRVETHLAAEEVLRRQTAEDGIRIRNRWQI